MKRVVIIGGAGFLGTAITKILLEKKYEVVVADLRPPQVSHDRLRFVQLNILSPFPHHQNLKRPFAVINLAGKRIFGRWNKKFKDLIYSTRIEGTRNLVNFSERELFRPTVLVSASAVGVYGDRGADSLKENASFGRTFLSMVAKDWEQAAWSATQLGVRVCLMRNGHILDPRGGLLKTLLPLYRLGLGGPLGSGKQFFPWVSLEDAARAYVEAMEDPSWAGPVNVVSPQPVTNRQFSEMIAARLGRPHWLSIPVVALRFLFGGFAREITVSQKVYPQKLLRLGFEWRDRDLGQFFRKKLN